VFTLSNNSNYGHKSVSLELTVKGIKGAFQDIVLYALYKLNEAHGYAIRNFINELLGVYAPSSGILYPTLRELEKEGLVSSTWRNRKRVYALTPKGREYVSTRLADIENLVNKARKAVNILISIGFLDLMEVIKRMWEQGIEIPQSVLEAIKQRIEEITRMLSSILK